MPKFGLLLFIQFIFLSKCLKLYNNCTQSSECLIGNSTCHEGKCSCLPDFKDINNNCYPIDIESKLGLNCTESSQCTGVGEYCSSFNVCLCLSTYVEVSSTCLPIIFPGNSNCLTSLQCSYTFPGSWCDQNHTCQCPEGSIIKGNTCILANNGIPLIQADNSIISNNFNPDKASFFDKITNFITLKTRSIFSNQQSETNDISGIRPGGRCNSDILCSGYPLAYCETVCKCKENSYNAGSTCIKLATEPQPITGSCPPNQVYSTEAGSCVNRVYPSQNCQYSEQCSAIESGSFCRNNICECVYGMVISNDKTKCVYKDNHCITKGTIWVPELGECKQVIIPGLESCSHSLQCSTAFNGSYCYERKCICPPDNPIPVDGTCGIKCQEGQSFSSITGSCLPNINPGNECTYTSQCHSAFLGTVCNSGICKCGGNKVFTGTNCAYSCPTGYMKGLNNICVPGCTKNQIEYNGECLSYAAPGQECKINAQCTGNSLCGNGICTCRSNMQIVSGICQVIKVFPDQSCSLGEECMGGSTCVDGICICQPGTVNVNNQCIKPILVPPNTACTKATVCSGGSHCINDICTCESPLVPINNTCTYPPSVLPNSPCPTGFENCLGGSSCIQSVCTCPAGTISEGGNCHRIIYVNVTQTCSESRICTGHSICIDHICTCPPPYYLKNKECILPGIALAGHSCANKQVCTDNAYCDNKKICTCIQPTVNQNGICMLTLSSNPGEPCDDTIICNGFSNCIDNICTCPPGTININGICKQILSDLGSCKTSQDCFGGSFCNTLTKKCICPDDTFAIENRCISNNSIPIETTNVIVNIQSSEMSDITSLSSSSSTIKTTVKQSSQKNVKNVKKNKKKNQVSPGGNCIQSYYKCINGADCVAGTCICPPDTRLINGKCTKELFAFPGEDCGSGQECTRNSICNHETLKCECINTLKIAIGRSCVDRLRSHPGYPCDNGEICIGGSVCFKGFCKCPGNQIVSDKICVEPRRLMPGNKCTDDDICTGNSECDRKTWMCQCRPHHIAIGGICTKIILAKPGEQCSGQQYRCILNSYCNGDTCICLSGMKLIDDQCRIPVKRQPGSYCGENEECTNLSTCINGRCVCNPPRILKNSKCEMTVDVAAGGVCSIHDKCLGGSNCINGRCLCNTNEYIHGGICVEKVYKNPGEHCDENQICSNGSYCSRSKYCICYQGYVIEDSKCVRKTRSRPGESCKNGERCIDNSTCIKDICTCPKSTILQGNKCIPNRVSKIGESCANGEKCINGSKCQPIAKICACPPGFVNRNEACVPIEGLISKKLSQTSEQFFKPEKIKNSFSFSKNNRETLKRNDFISPGLCNKTSDCDENAKCKNNICVCNQNYVLKNGFCIRIISAVDPPSGGSLGHKCTSSNECHVNNSHCKNGRCLCLPGFKMLGVNQCINGKFGKLSRNEPIKHPEEIKLPFSKRPSLPGGKCIDSKECLNKSFCHQGKCVCPRGMKTIKNHCIDVEMVPPLALCSDGQICTGNSECSVNGICLCPKNHTLYKGFCQTDEQIKNMKNLLGNEVTKKKGLVAIPNLKIMGKISLQEKFEILSSKTKTYGTTTTVAPKTTKKQGSTPKMRKSTKLPFDGIAKSITLEKEEILKILQENNNQTRQTTRPPKETLSTKKSSSKVFQTTKPTKPHTTSTSTVSINTSTKTSKTNSTTTTLVTSTTFSPTTIKTSSTKKLTKTTLKPSTKIISSTIVNQAILTTTTTTKIVPSTTTSPTTEVYDNTINLLTIDNHTNTIPTTPESPPIIKNPINITNIVSSIVKSNEILDNKDIIVTLSPETSTNNSTTKYELIPSTEHQIISLPETTMPKINKTITNNVNITSIVEELLSIKEPFILTTTPNEIEKSLEEDNSKEMEEIKEILPPIQVISPHKSLSNVNFYKIFPNLVSNTHYSSNVNTKPLTIPYSLFQISYPGQFCDESLVFCSSNSKCEQNICQCEENYYLYNNECLSIDKNVICISNDDCPLGAFCFDNECQCEEGMRYSRFVNPGSSCSNGETCIGGSICKKNICVCPPNKPIIINNICSKKTKNYSVDESELVNVNNNKKTTKINYLNLTKPLESNPISRNKRDITIGLGYACTNDTVNVIVNPCINNAFCLEGYCQCYDDFIQVGYSCYPRVIAGNVIKEPGENCENDHFCNGGSTCDKEKKICQCNTGTVLFNSHCIRKNLVGEGFPCDSTDNCEIGLVCINGICVKTSQPDNVTVIEVNAGEKCPSTSSNVICKCIGNSILVNNYCICPGGERIINGTCIGIDTVSNPGESCITNITECLGNSTCLDNICTCNEGYININKQCVPINITTLPITTTSTTTTTTSGFTIINTTTTLGYTTINTTTTGMISTTSIVYFPDIGEPCTATIGCRNGAICLNGICQCPPNTIYINGRCMIQYTTANPGEPCSSDGIVCIGGSACINRICTCPQGSYIVDKKCILGSLTTPSLWKIVDPGFPCGMPFTRCGGGSFCSGGLCECLPNFVPINNICTDYSNVLSTTKQPFTPLYPGDICGSSTSFCTGGSSCINGYCQCLPGQIPSGNICIDNINPSSTISPIISLLPGQSCDSVCELLRTCIKYCGGGSICIGGVCTCSMGHIAINGICQINKELGLGNNVQYVTDEPTWKSSYRYPGQDCNIFTTCTGGSACDGKFCQCPSGFVPTNNDRSCINANYLKEISTRNNNNNNIINNNTNENLLYKRPELKTVIKPYQSLKSYNRKKKCSDDSHCDGGMICNNMAFCQCPKNLVNFNGQCLDLSLGTLAYPGSKCISEDFSNKKFLTCANGSECNKKIGYCTCPEGTLPNLSNFCVTAIQVDNKLALPGKGCDLNITPNCANNGICKDNFCICPYGTKNNGNGVCSSRVTLEESKILKEFNKKLINDTCNDTIECIFPSKCIKGLCSCPPEMIVSKERTCINRRKTSEIGEYCDEFAGIYCINNSACIKHYCTCKQNYIPIRINNTLEYFTINDEYFDIESNIDNSFITQPIEESLLECPHDGSCSLPDCFCSITGLNIPGNIQYNETPQMILLTFDGPITDNVINIYKNIFSGKHKNKNGCPIKGTFFISHEFNNYDQTQWLYSRGHEIGVNSITHRSLSDLSEEEWKDEMVGLREALKKFSYIDSRKIKGLRAPQFALGGEGQFSMMEKENFIYDNTQTTYDGPYWPQTLHFKTPWRCIGQVCPNTSHDIWEFPINMLTRDDGKQALFMLQAVTRFDSSDQIANMLLRNMEKNLNSNKAPFILNIESDFLTAIPYNGALRALDIFITKALQRNDTYFVTMEEALTWIQRPTRLSKLQNFFPWQCRRYKNEYQRPCETPSICSYTDGPTNYPHSFRVCGSCPHVYPWLKNPTGKGNTFF
ncbi:Epidermal growth factor-like domain and Polysaccharide deacetylase domain and EB domain and Cysteine-rich repeat and Glycoside hydrolase/deacetylase, beta/alpha-barrel domain-containing protein [Strongyloides ratti]|uniref:Epidermal growth factor-like domain and Polysaccharide deacetylase domain and EB domain and Cysteine-rich repeat and Glycoside hydrolase/deacetylase, beta/alpha-barrel domain-containing protein n=1 Tax=Strongyloides ratti TaxID=34506 RepID=A0A090MZL4_STRRB|nr:Epidermal growth factor-like domain and Polysaccharide deacetylase domain and EB domain and Cysteine-rich repeat and Glycoside hydrolase/deacetylase, beta/alpha-barrel domain-containing protein [Strongyloides ratti]CEF69139.1 Epidermal growth factor-like domain and Polysaccharide deacetylase domain and EB domain and Cysteine-rich repeat and Glycoside hydrolase/deacetylase, beta/alpha-barrel domain-containing protein [Strongyloides ratti]